MTGVGHRRQPSGRCTSTRSSRRCARGWTSCATRRAAIGCWDNRYIDVVAADGSATSKSFAMSWWARPGRPRALGRVASDARLHPSARRAPPLAARAGRAAAAVPRGHRRAGRGPALRVRELPSGHRDAAGRMTPGPGRGRRRVESRRSTAEERPMDERAWDSPILPRRGAALQDRFDGRRPPRRSSGKTASTTTSGTTSGSGIESARSALHRVDLRRTRRLQHQVRDPGSSRSTGRASSSTPIRRQLDVRTLGNIARNPNDGLLFRHTSTAGAAGSGSTDARRSSTTRRASRAPLRRECRVLIECEIYPNSPRYVPDLLNARPSPHRAAPRGAGPRPPEWKQRDYIRGILRRTTRTGRVTRRPRRRGPAGAPAQAFGASSPCPRRPAAPRARSASFTCARR